jgi:serine protease Do
MSGRLSNRGSAGAEQHAVPWDGFRLQTVVARMPQCFSWVAIRLLAGSFALVACATAPPQLQAPVTVAARAAPVSFAAAVRRGLPVTVGVYGVNAPQPDDSDAAGTAPPVSRADGRLRPPLPGPAWADNGEPEQPGGDSVNIGAGFMVDTDGAIATAAHVVADSAKIVVKLTDRRVFEAEVVGIDAESDIALIRIPVSSPEAPVFGQSAALEPGDWVLAIGDPYGLNRSVSAGVVGGGARHFVEDRDALFIQSDLALNPGNSGGPLLNAAGAIVGMNLRMMVGPFGTAGVSLSMPIELVLKIVRDLRDGELDERPRLGAKFEDVSPPAAVAAGRLLADGALVTEVAAGSIARQIGLLVDDIVVGFNGRALSDSADFVKALLAWHAVAGTRVTVYRDGDYHELAMD